MSKKKRGNIAIALIIGAIAITFFALTILIKGVFA